ncbi:hypothetical protein [Hymenobacter metallicola]|uniref:Glycosyltransferase RgtA/B/C/D-like domain-containing protein n=1 Tax=Hymenobacter metallicola TaxID=2563114 RepID=A0A4Z0PZ33_9BACT|nr:hypothetical protein [Hymenobacter metallicola]TGE23028.1 hypothetical protein E5K02_21995 [Hymenobacter metallicola]
MTSPSRIAWLLSVGLLLWLGLYVSSALRNGVNIISSDSAGYYLYLPAIFVYDDLQQLQFREATIAKYHYAGLNEHATLDPVSGNYVLKYSSGLALQELPFFLVAHAVAEPLGYPADGYSQPYQWAIRLGSLLAAALSLWLVRRALLPRFGEWPTALALLILVLGTNYLNYSGGQGGMTHNWLFGWYAVLLLLTPSFYARPTLGKALGIGATVGIMTLTRPTEILAVLLPLLWGLELSRAFVLARLAFWRRHLGLLCAALLAGALVVSIQLVYWHYAIGSWLYYSYGEEGFNWLKPHLWEGIFSFRSGWLIYSPLLVTALVGFGPLRRQQPAAFWPMLVYLLLFLYVTFAWEQWTYGGALGQRAMVQSYAVLAWPLAAALAWLLARPRWAAAYGVVAVVGCYYGFWLTLMAQAGGLLAAGDMTRSYLWRILFRYEVPSETRLLLDSNSEFTGTATHQRVVWEQGFEQETKGICGTPALQGNCSLALDSLHPQSTEYVVAAKPGDFQWLRASALARAEYKEWEMPRMTQYVVRFRRGTEVVKERTVRLQRALDDSWPRELHFDMRPPKEEFDNVSVVFLYYGTRTGLLLDNAKITVFDEQ